MLTIKSIESRWRAAAERGEAASAKQLAALRKAAAGWSALSGWLDLDDGLLSEPGPKALADSALALVEDRDLRSIALLEIACRAIDSDKPSGWAFCRENGFDPRMPDLIEPGPSGLWVLGGASRGPWASRAVERGSWSCLEMLADSGDGKRGLEVLLAKAGEAKGSAEEADWIERAHPALAAWGREERGEAPAPRSAWRALERSGLGPAWDWGSFRWAASRAALRGSKGALSGCLANGVSCREAALEGCHEDLARPGALGRSRSAAKAWEPRAAWIESSMGEGASLRLLEALAFDDLEASLARFGARLDSQGDDALRWIAERGCLDAQAAGERLSKLQGFAIELSEGGAGSGPEARRLGKVMDAIEAWERAAGCAPRARRGLKA